MRSLQRIVKLFTVRYKLDLKALAVTAYAGLFLTNLANKGTAGPILKTLAGHRSISTTAAYLYSSPSQLKAAVELV
jgi:site-specific recombinase XerD